MLDSLRSLAKTWIGKILGAFLIVGLAGFGISNVIFTLGTNTVATVGGEDISVRDFQRAYDSQLNSFAQQMGRVPTAEEAVAFDLPSVVLNRLAAEAAINKFGADMGLGISDQRLTKMVQADPSFAGTLGNYDPNMARQVLAQSGMTEAEYRNLQTDAARRQQLISGLLAGSPTPKAAVQLVSRYSGDTRTVDYFVLNAQALPPVAEPTETELAAYLTEHQAEFRTKETRSVEVMVLSPETLAATKTIGEDAITAEFERTKASRVKIEKREIQQIALATPEQVTTFEQGKAGGKPLAELLTETGLALSPIGTLAKSEVTDTTLADTAFGLALNDYAIIPGVGGQRVVTVTAITPGGEITLAEAHDEIARSLALAEARNEYIDILDQIEELRAAFQPLSQIAERFSFKVTPVALTAGGEELSAVADIPETDRAKVAGAVFAANQENLAPTVVLGANRNVWFDLTKVDAARDQTLDEVRDAVVTAWTNGKTNEALTAEVERLTAELKTGKDFAEVATGIGQFPILSQPLTRNGDGTNVLDQTVATAIFNGGPEHFGAAVNGDGDQVIFHVVEINPATAEAPAQAQQFVEEGTREALYSDFVNGLRDEVGIRVNRPVLDQVLAVDNSTGL